RLCARQFAIPTNDRCVFASQAAAVRGYLRFRRLGILKSARTVVTVLRLIPRAEAWCRARRTNAAVNGVRHHAPSPPQNAGGTRARCRPRLRATGGRR